MLEKTVHALEKKKFLASLVKGPEGDKALIFLGTDYKDREAYVEMVIQEQSLLVQEEGVYYWVSCQYTFPFIIKDLSLSQVGSYAHFLNRLSEFPGFELDELANTLRFRHVFFSKGSVDPVILSNILGLFKLALSLYGPSLEDLAEGRTTLNKLLKEVAKAGKGSESKI